MTRDDLLVMIERERERHKTPGIRALEAKLQEIAIRHRRACEAEMAPVVKALVQLESTIPFFGFGLTEEKPDGVE